MEKKKCIITIARQFGSLGRPIAKELAEALNIEYYDRDIVDLAAKDMDKHISEVNELDEAAYRKMRYPLGLGDRKRTKDVFSAQKKVILEMANSDRSCIIVGRCSDYILKDYENSLHVFIYAPYASRLSNCVNSLGLKAEEARKMIEEVDKARERYYMRYADGEQTDTVKNRQMLLDSSMLGEKGTVELLEYVIRKKFPMCF